tara:strand:+ start:465 stop:731 length:267 start_codon:yes stop_codon:yes gene_type:complete
MEQKKPKYEEGVFYIFKNKFKQDDRHPDYKGKGKVEGKMKDASIWKNRDKNGDIYLKLKLEKEYVKPDANASSTPPPKFEKNPDDIPF